MAMKLYVLILNKMECLHDILYEFMKAGISGATIFNSTGAMQYFEHDMKNAPPIFGTLRKYLRPDNENNKTIIIVLEERQLETVRKIVEQVTGGLDQPDSGIAFTMPIDSVDWLKR